MYYKTERWIMKSNYFKYIFIIFAIAIMIFAIVKIKKDEQNKEAQMYETKEIMYCFTSLPIGL